MNSTSSDPGVKTEEGVEVPTRQQAFGATLRQYREDAGVTNISLAQATRISLPFIDALESGDLNKLPGQVFGRGFIKNICRMIEIDPTELLEEFDHCWDRNDIPPPVPRPINSSPPRMTTGEMLQAVRTSLPALSRTAWGSIAALGAAICLIWFGYRFIPDFPKTTVAETPSLNEEEAALPISVDGEAAPELPEDSVVPAKEEIVPEEQVVPVKIDKKGATNSEQVLEFKVTEAVRVRMEFDGSKTTTKELKPDTYRYTFDSSAEFLIFDASALDISYNGRPIGSLGQKGRVRRISFKASADTSLNF